MIKVNRQTPALSGGIAVAQEPAKAQGAEARPSPRSQTERNRGDSMTQRDRPTADAAADQLPVVFAASAAPSFWEQWYAQASPEQREQVLELARQRGVLCPSQLPANEPASRRSLLADVLAGTAQLEPLEAP